MLFELFFICLICFLLFCFFFNETYVIVQLKVSVDVTRLISKFPLLLIIFSNTFLCVQSFRFQDRVIIGAINSVRFNTIHSFFFFLFCIELCVFLYKLGYRSFCLLSHLKDFVELRLVPVNIFYGFAFSIPLLGQFPHNLTSDL